MSGTPLAQELERRRYAQIAERDHAEFARQRQLCRCGDQRPAHGAGWDERACSVCGCGVFDWAGETLDTLRLKAGLEPLAPEPCAACGEDHD